MDVKYGASSSILDFSLGEIFHASYSNRMLEGSLYIRQLSNKGSIILCLVRYKQTASVIFRV